MPRPRVVVFDAYGTLLDVHSAVARHAGRLGDVGPALSMLWRAKRLEASWIVSATGDYSDFWMLTDRALDYALRAHGIADAAVRADLLAAYRDLDAFLEAIPALTALAGVPAAILSNGTPDMLAAVLSVGPLRRCKPDVAVFALATARFRCRPHEPADLHGLPPLLA